MEKEFTFTPDEENELKALFGEGLMDSRRTADAIMKLVVPELHAILARAGETEE